MLNFHLLTAEQIKVLAGNLGSPFIDFLVYCAYDSGRNVEEMFRKTMLNNDGKVGSSAEIRNMLN